MEATIVLSTNFLPLIIFVLPFLPLLPPPPPPPAPPPPRPPPAWVSASAPFLPGRCRRATASSRENPGRTVDTCRKQTRLQPARPLLRPPWPAPWWWRKMFDASLPRRRVWSFGMAVAGLLRPGIRCSVTASSRTTWLLPVRCGKWSGVVWVVCCCPACPRNVGSSD